MLVGDDGQDKDGDVVVTPWAMEMTLWDTVTNEMTTVPHPPGYDDHDTLRFVFHALAEEYLNFKIDEQ